eukprot:CAMPEP_0174913780 /NCGR_PEP_ID=MMETSP0167-20121228/80500_1 /TAXON_ID=38298 /ORGANISM="Rhodella maculata, Strain CCMP736" /LENGTH=237 /DNA_ID=CAMNT_0016158515 /DNA_START=41 /DNA_END=755 /DNA_ORIENTATION=+
MPPLSMIIPPSPYFIECHNITSCSSSANLPPSQVQARINIRTPYDGANGHSKNNPVEIWNGVISKELAGEPLVSDTYAQSIGINPEVGGKLSDEARRNLVSKGMAAAKSRLIEGGGTFSGFPMGSEVWPLEDNSPMYLSSELAHNLDIFRSNSGSVEDDGPPDFIPTTKKMHEFRKRLGLSKMPGCPFVYGASNRVLQSCELSARPSLIKLWQAKMHEFRKMFGLSKMPENVSMLSL